MTTLGINFCIICLNDIYISAIRTGMLVIQSQLFFLIPPVVCVHYGWTHGWNTSIKMPPEKELNVNSEEKLGLLPEAFQEQVEADPC